MPERLWTNLDLKTKNQLKLEGSWTNGVQKGNKATEAVDLVNHVMAGRPTNQPKPC